MSSHHLCPFCSASLLCQIRNGKPYWFCPHCRQTVPYGIYEEDHTPETNGAIHPLILTNLPSDHQIDQLTKIANYHRFWEYMTQEWQRMSRDKTELSLILCEINFPEQFTDIYGEQAEHKYLQQFAIAIRTAAKRPADLVARYRYQKFAVLLPCTPQAGANQVAKEIHFRLTNINELSLETLPQQNITISLGIATINPDSHASPQILIDDAEAALIKAKEQYLTIPRIWNSFSSRAN